jgi:hypothetical protein
MNVRSTRPWYFVLLLVALTGCAVFKNTPKQDYVWAMWDECKSTHEIRTSSMSINRVDPDGRYWSNVTSGPYESEWPRIQACMSEQFKANPYLSWLKARQGSTPPAGSGSGVTVAALAPAATTGPVPAPVWHVGDEWQYAYESPAGSGTFVWSVSRIETLDGEPNYVVTTGTREIFHRVSDLASTLERVDGVVVVRDTPARLMYTWPLAVGKSWEESHKQERPVERSTVERKSQWTVEAEETVSVPAGTFRTLRITWRNKNTGAVVTEMWYAPDVKQWVKIREVLSNGIREREMVSFKLK